MTRFIRPDTASMVRARLATSSPNPPNDSAPMIASATSAHSAPCTATPKNTHANPTMTITSSASVVIRLKISDSR